MMTKVQVKASATCGDENTFPNATRYIWGGSAALSTGTRWRTARYGRKEPARSFSSPGMIQPGPAAREAVHQAVDLRHSSRWSGESHLGASPLLLPSPFC